MNRIRRTLNKHLEKRPKHYKYAFFTSLPFFAIPLIALIGSLSSYSSDVVYSGSSAWFWIGLVVVVLLWLPFALLNLALLYFAKSDSQRGKWFAVGSVIISIWPLLILIQGMIVAP